MSERDEAVRPNFSRRRLFIVGATGLVGAGLVLPGSQAVANVVEGEVDGAQKPTAVTPYAMISRNDLGTNNCHFYYEPSGNRTSFSFDQTFYNRLGYWRTFIDQNSGSHWGYPNRIYSYGAYVDKPGYHGSGRAFDIAKVLFATTTGGTIHVSCRYDIWRNQSNFATHAKRYWGLAASLLRRFSYVITYPYNSAHHNHIHVDNAVYSLLDDCSYSTGTSTQTYIVQGACRYVWGHDTDVDGIWGSQTESHSTSVLRRIGQSSGTIRTASNFQAFLTATFRKASNRQQY